VDVLLLNAFQVIMEEFENFGKTKFKQKTLEVLKKQKWNWKHGV